MHQISDAPHKVPAWWPRLLAWGLFGVILVLLQSCGNVSAPWLSWSPRPTLTPTPRLQPFNRAVATAEAGSDQMQLASALFERANMHYGEGNLAEALADYDGALAIDPENARIYNNRAVAHATVGNVAQALADYEQAVIFDPGYVRAYQNRLVLHQREGDLAGMVVDYGWLATFDLANRATYAYRQGLLLRRLGDDAGARRAFDAAIEANPQQVDAFYERGVLNFAEGQLDAAIADLEEAVILSPRAADAHYARGLAYSARGEHPRAIDAFTQALALRPDHAAALVARADALYTSGDRAGAIEDLQRLQQMEPEMDDGLQHAVAVLRMHLGL